MVILALLAFYCWLVSAFCCALCGLVVGEIECMYEADVALFDKFVFQWGDWFYALLYWGTPRWFQASSESDRCKG